MMSDPARGVGWGIPSAVPVIMLSADWRREGPVEGRCLEDSWANVTVTHMLEHRMPGG